MEKKSVSGRHALTVILVAMHTVVFAVEQIPGDDPRIAQGATIFYQGSASTSPPGGGTIATGTGPIAIVYWDAAAVAGIRGPMSLFGFQGRAESPLTQLGSEYQTLGYSNLSLGKIGVKVLAKADGIYISDASATIAARFQDVLTLNLPSASNDPTSSGYATALTYSWTIDGSGAGRSTVASSLGLGLANGGGPIAEALRLSYDNYSGALTTWTTNTVTPSYGGGVCIGWTCVGTVTVYGTAPTFRIVAELQATAVLGPSLNSEVDFSNTASFAFVAAPHDMTISSVSGVFLTSPVPEGNRTAILLVGLLVLRTRFAYQASQNRPPI